MGLVGLFHVCFAVRLVFPQFRSRELSLFQFFGGERPHTTGLFSSLICGSRATCSSEDWLRLGRLFVPLPPRASMRIHHVRWGAPLAVSFLLALVFLLVVLSAVLVLLLARPERPM